MKRLLLLGGLSILLTGCGTSFGPNALRKTHPGYNEAVTASLNNELLLNMVRMKYRDNPIFLEITTIAANQVLTGTGSFSANANSLKGENYIPSVGGTYTQQPTINYNVLRGKEFAGRMLAQIYDSICYGLIQNGWNIERIFNLYVDRINNLENAPTACKPTPEKAPDYEKFHRLTAILGELQYKRLIEIDKKPDNNDISVDMVFRFKPSAEMADKIAEAKSLMGLRQDKNDFKFKNNFLELKNNRITIRFRSMMGIMFFLSQAIEIPSEHIEKGLVTVTKNADGSPFNWDNATGKLFKVYCDKKRPVDAFAWVRYHGYWYYIKDNDLHSKSTFHLLSELFSVQAGRPTPREPVLMLSI
ncbi:MAG: hypothetical protein A2007_04695 [Verrucomicrobia bacterium GWC2_42_7]|nr:MAG: hypothetical protein A2007_04695 [Verrucomicrobia bacterium GWC2_42_7]